MNNQLETLTIINTFISSLTAICALYIAYVALRHTAKPNIKINMLNRKTFLRNEEVIFIFECINIGYWYAKPVAIDVTVFCNFEPEFKLKELGYGSSQTFRDTDTKIGVGKMIYLKAKGLKLTFGEEGEQIHVKVITPNIVGEYKIRLSAYSGNGVSYERELLVKCTN